MGGFIRGDVVVIEFVFSDFTGTKRRPAFVVADLAGDDIILCQITSRARTDKYSINLEDEDFISGKLSTKSVVRPNKIFTAEKSMIAYTACKISEGKSTEIIETIIDVIGGKI
ncbi:MAG: type II toxin-antitoxin system PemK/MazF family toxin [Defluviitaleaceae bacterium]|nr:type II toxin-antitoxin system PemK/MazF family toxin [Defluviitaleaceae bacterium]